MRTLIVFIALLMITSHAYANDEVRRLNKAGFHKAAVTVECIDKIKNLGGAKDFATAEQLYHQGKAAWEESDYAKSAFYGKTADDIFIFPLISAYSTYLMTSGKNLEAISILKEGIAKAADAYFYDQCYLYAASLNNIYLRFGFFARSWKLIDEVQEIMDELYPYEGFEKSNADFDTVACRHAMLRLRLDTVIASGNLDMVAYDDLVGYFEDTISAYKHDPRYQFYAFEHLTTLDLATSKGKSMATLQAERYFVNIFLLQNFLKLFQYYGDAGRVEKIINVLSKEYASNITFAANAKGQGDLAVMKKMAGGIFSGLTAPFDGTKKRAAARYLRFPLQNELWLMMSKLSYLLAEKRYTDAYNLLPEGKASIKKLNKNYAAIDKYFRDMDNLDRDAFDFHILEGKVLEKNGKIEAARAVYSELIEKNEQLRGTLPVEMRKNFFNGMGKDAYLGMIRIDARVYEKNPTPEHFNALLSAINRIHGRQLKELNEAYDASSVDLATIQNRLDDDDLICILFDVDDAIAVAGISKHKTTGTLFEKPDDFDRELMRFKKNLVDNFYYDKAKMKKISAPLFAQLSDYPAAKRLHILSDGAISVLPFDIYLDDSEEMIGASYEMDNLTTLDFKNTDPDRDGTTSFLGIGDPDFQGKGHLSMLAKYFVPLPETRDEINDIAGFFQKKKILLGAEAKESTIKTMDLRPYRYIHFATHGILGGELTESNEPALVLSAEAGEDGLLSTSEVSKLKINADITVLSACNKIGRASCRERV